MNLIRKRETNRHQAIGNFLYRIPDYKSELEGYAAEDNSRIKARLKELLDNDCAGAREFHSKRTRLIPW